MTYSHIRSGYFLSRPNRFIAWVEIDGRKEKCHVKNTGRCKELLTDRALVYIQAVSYTHLGKRFRAYFVWL